ncbi:MAG TPA: hypothetical protein VN277_05720 [Acidiferrobacterales bacterium]|nr:hypothetical protein [Acidiferrobacterales bacterium]
MATKKGSGGHSGVERRRMERRTKGEQRNQVRWEPKKTDRRKGHGRRATDGLRYPR